MSVRLSLPFIKFTPYFHLILAISKEPLSKSLDQPNCFTPITPHLLHLALQWKLSIFLSQRTEITIQNPLLEQFAKTYQMICEEVKKPEIKYESAFT